MKQARTVETGNEPGAPVNPQLVRKALITTVIAAVVFALVYAAIALVAGCSALTAGNKKSKAFALLL